MISSGLSSLYVLPQDAPGQTVQEQARYDASRNAKKSLTPAERQKADKITNKLNLINQELANAANLFRQGRKTDAARLYVACGEALQQLATETQDDPFFVEALKSRVRDCVYKAEICRSGKPIQESEPGIQPQPKVRASVAHRPQLAAQ